MVPPSTVIVGEGRIVVTDVMSVVMPDYVFSIKYALPSGVGVPDVEAGSSLALPGEEGKNVVANRDSDLDGGDDEVGTFPMHRKDYIAYTETSYMVPPPTVIVGEGRIVVTDVTSVVVPDYVFSIKYTYRVTFWSWSTRRRSWKLFGTARRRR